MSYFIQPESIKGTKKKMNGLVPHQEEIGAIADNIGIKVVTNRGSVRLTASYIDGINIDEIANITMAMVTKIWLNLIARQYLTFLALKSYWK